MTWLTLALVLSLAWTSPAYRAVPGSCAADTLAIAVPETCIVFMARQAPTWRDSSAVMVADPVAWGRLWPKVHAEAEPVNVGSVVANPGAACSLGVPDSAGVFFYVRSTTGGALSCIGSSVQR